MNILFITGGAPWPPTIGVNQRTHLLHKALSECGNVDMVINSQYVDLSEDEKNFLQEKYGLLHLVNPLHQSLKGRKNDISVKFKLFNYYKRKQAEWFGSFLVNKENAKLLRNSISENGYDLIVSRYLRSTVNTGTFNFRPHILDVDDLNMDLAQRTKKNINISKKVLRLIYGFSVKKLEIHYLRKIGFLWFAKEIDQHIIGHKHSCILPNIPFYGDAKRNISDDTRENPSIALFIGSMKHAVNIEGVDRFIKIIWPHIKNKKNDAVLRVVGSGMTEDQKSDWNQYEGVEAVGFVKDIESEYLNCAFSVIPLSKGGGTKIKLIESLGYGRTCVTDAHSFRGYEKILKNGEDLYVSSSDDTFINNCLKLFNDHQKRRDMALSGKNKVDQFFTYDNFRNIVQHTVSRVANEKFYAKP